MSIELIEVSDGLIDLNRDLKDQLGYFRRKFGNIDVYIFWSSLEILISTSKLSHLDQESERMDINLSKNWLEFQIMS